MKKLTVLFFLVTSVAFSQIKLSNQAEISVVTIGPYQGELYSAFGHSAFRVFDPVNRIDAFFNYGVFDFDQPNFYLNFARGYLYYKLGVDDYKLYEQYYISQNRYVHLQVLNLTVEENQKLFNYLINNARPENAFYRYDYFYNNCATKMRDVIVDVFGDSVRFNTEHIKTNYTIRDLTDIYLKYQPWGDLGIDICLGLPMDKKAAPLEYMFLPDYVEAGFDHATFSRGASTIPMVRNKINVFDPPTETPTTSWFQPIYVFLLFLVITILVSIRDLRKNALTQWFDTLVFLVLGLLGVLFLALWFATDHNAAAKNYNLLWALPTHVVAVAAFMRQPKWLEKYFLITALITALLLLTWPLLPQDIHYSLVPLVIAILIRSFVQFRVRRIVRKNQR